MRRYWYSILLIGSLMIVAGVKAAPAMPGILDRAREIAAVGFAGGFWEGKSKAAEGPGDLGERDGKVEEGNSGREELRAGGETGDPGVELAGPNDGSAGLSEKAARPGDQYAIQDGGADAQNVESAQGLAGNEQDRADAGSHGAEQDRAAAGSPGAEQDRAAAGHLGTDQNRAAAGSPGADQDRAAAGTPGTDQDRAASGSPGTDQDRAAAGSPGAEQDSTAPNSTTAPSPATDNFSDVLFIGDSRTVGLSEYGDLGEAEVFANSGMSVFNLFDSRVTLKSGGKQTLEQVLSGRSFRTVYLMLGINELGYDDKSIVKQYQAVVERIRAAQPEATLVLGANLHVTGEKAAKSSLFNNQRINSLNAAIKTIAENNGCGYMDVNQLFDDENGNLSTAYSTDGAHILGKYYSVWVEWIRGSR